jgi:hypothetical protein
LPHANEKVEARIQLGEKRLASVLTRHGIAHIRTLEQKIADAGPFDQRIEPVLLYKALARLKEQGEVLTLADPTTTTKWYYMRGTSGAILTERLAAQRVIYEQVHNTKFGFRLGSALEMAVFRSILTTDFPYWGGFARIDLPDDKPFSKMEPPTSYALRNSQSPLDFHVKVDGHMLGIEVKNMREWTHTDSAEVKKMLRKATDLDMVPVLIARRIPYATMQTLETCGVLAHQTYNQRYPVTGSELADKARHKDLLGYHDIRLGNEPDARMLRFFNELLPILAGRARAKFDAQKDLLRSFATNEISYNKFYRELQIRLGRWQRFLEDEAYPE